MGVSGPVIFNIMSGNYDSSINIVPIAGTNAFNTVTFKSQTGNPNDVILTGQASNYEIIRIDSAENIIIQDITITQPDGIAKMKIALYGGCNNIKIINNLFNNPSSGGYSYIGYWAHFKSFQ